MLFTPRDFWDSPTVLEAQSPDQSKSVRPDWFFTPEDRSRRRPTILDYNADNPEEVLLAAGGAGDFDLWAINVVTGRKRILATEYVSVGKGVLLNRQFEAEIAIHDTLLTGFPHPYLVEDGGWFLRWSELNEISNGPLRSTFSLSPENVMGERSFPLGFDEDPNVLYFASNVGRDTFGVYALDLETGQRLDFSIENPDFDLVPLQFHDFTGKHALIFDRYSRQFLGVRYNADYRTAAWIHPDWQTLQRKLEEAFPGSSVEILEWDRGYSRFLVRVYGPTDPGAFHIYHPETGESIEFARVAPGIDARKDAYSADFTFEASPGRMATGRVLIPRNPIAEPIPLIIICRDTFWDRLGVGFDRQAMALARMGYAVARFNGRGAWGFGSDDRLAIKDGYEVEMAAEIVRLVGFLQQHVTIDPTKVALMGSEFGGFLALRTLQLYPEYFRGAITVDAPFSPDEWLEETRWGGNKSADLKLFRPYLGDEELFKNAPLVDRAEDIQRPVQMFAFRKYDGSSTSADYNHVYTLSRHLKGHGVPVERVDLHPDFNRGLPEAQARVIERIRVFLNLHLFEYEVELGELEYRLIEEDSDESDEPGEDESKENFIIRPPIPTRP